MTWRSHRPGEHGRPHHRPRRRRGRPDHLLRRHRLRRPAQDRPTTASPSSTSSTRKRPSPSATSRVAPSDPNIVWVGTGETNPRNSVSYGDGVYKTTDGGKTWKNMGLKKSFQIGKIVIHPKNPNIVYVGALGRLYGPNEERGLFKTDRRRQDLEEGPVRRRQDRRHRHAHGPDRPEHAARRHVGAEARRVRQLLRHRRPTGRPGRVRPDRHATAPAAGSSRPPTAARPGRSSPARRRDRAADREDRPHRPRLLAQDQGPRLRHHRHREGRHGPAAADRRTWASSSEDEQGRRRQASPTVTDGEPRRRRPGSRPATSSPRSTARRSPTTTR